MVPAADRCRAVHCSDRERVRHLAIEPAEGCGTLALRARWTVYGADDVDPMATSVAPLAREVLVGREGLPVAGWRDGGVERLQLERVVEVVLALVQRGVRASTSVRDRPVVVDRVHPVVVVEVRADPRGDVVEQ